MDDRSRKRSSRRGTQIDDLPSCLIMDILLRLPTTSLVRCRVVCRSWNLVFSDPLFVKVHLAQSPTYLMRLPNSVKPMKFYSRYCRNLVPGMSGETLESEVNLTVQGSDVARLNSSSNGLLCLDNSKPCDEVSVCNPILGQYITIKPGNTETVPLVRYSLGFSSRSNQFKILQVNFPKHSITPNLARIYTIGDGTRQWKSVGIAPSCPYFRRGGFLNGSFHWLDEKTQQIFYFNFDSEQFGSLPSPPLPPALPPRLGDGRRFETIGVLDGCLFFYARDNRGLKVTRLWKMGFWIMKEYGVEESWTKMFSIDNSDSSQILPSLYKKLLLLYENCKIQVGGYGTAYTPSFISLQDVAKGEQLTLIS